MIRAIAVVVMLTFQATGPGPLVGRWDAETRSRGGLGSWMEFAADGSCHQTMGAMVDGTWALNGSALTLNATAAGQSAPPMTWNVAVAGDTVTMTVSGQSRTMTRVGAAVSNAPSHVGVWTYKHPTGEAAFEEYAADGRFLFRLPMTSKRCRWTAAEESLRITMDGHATERRFRLAGDRLTLEEPSGSQTFHREQAGIVPPKR